VTESDLPVVQMSRYRWGDPARPVDVPEAALAALKHLGVDHPAAPQTEIVLPPARLPQELVNALELDDSDQARLDHTRGWSTTDLLRLRAGDVTDAPDAVVYPESDQEVVALLQACAEHRIAVVPYAGGTSVVGGLAPEREGFTGVVAIDLRRLDRMLALDEISRTATMQAGLRATAAEALLAERGYTLGHFPQSYEGASIGGYAATRSSGQASAGYGRFDEMVVGLTLATPRGTIELGRAPRSAAGPDLRQLVLGSEGAFGIVTSVVVRIRPRPVARVFEGWRFDSFAAGLDAIRRLAQDGPLPTVLRLADEAETAVNLADPDVLTGGTGGCLAVCGYEGTADEVPVRRTAVGQVLQDAGGTALGESAGEIWREGRYRAPYLRDPLLDAGALVETLETATFWSGISALKAAVTDALTTTLAGMGTPPLVLCHVSHVYETGASLYFTVVCAQTAEPVGQWHAAKQAANLAIGAAGGTISHHHGVGTDHRDAYADEVGPLAIEALTAVKHTLDPDGILNPGVLLAQDRSSRS
jgi:alkyldihydroxyacetonephosphate synthase